MGRRLKKPKQGEAWSGTWNYVGEMYHGRDKRRQRIHARAGRKTGNRTAEEWWSPRSQNLDLGASCKTPLKPQNVSGHDFSRAGRTTKSCWALAPAIFCFQLFAVPLRLKPESKLAICGTTKVVPRHKL